MNKSMGVGIFVVTLFTMSPSSASVIYAEVSGSSAPATITEPTDGDSLHNGDFVITRHIGSATPSLLGDGVNEDTAWVFDFGPSASMLTGETLSSAMLTLALQTTGGVGSDTIEIVGLGARAASEIRSLPAGFNGSITFDLLPYYSSASILAELTNPIASQIGMIYEDDAIISYARLTLASVPVPATLPLICAGMVGWYYRRCKVAPVTRDQAR